MQVSVYTLEVVAVIKTPVGVLAMAAMWMPDEPEPGAVFGMGSTVLGALCYLAKVAREGQRREAAVREHIRLTEASRWN